MTHSEVNSTEGSRTMPSGRNEPPFSSIIPERDDIVTHQQRMAGKPPTYSQQTKLSVFACLLALLGLGLAGFAYWQLFGTQQSLIAAEQRIAVLEKRLDLSDDESTQSVTAIRAKLKWADSEIRKLWGVSNDRNRKSIAANKQLLTQLEKTVKSTSKSAKETLKTTQAQQSVLDKVEKQTAQQQQLVQKVSADMVMQQQGAQAIVDLANKLEQQLKTLQIDMIPRVKSNEEAIAAIDAYRRNINRDILQLQKQLQQKSSTPPGS